MIPCMQSCYHPPRDPVKAGGAADGSRARVLNFVMSWRMGGWWFRLALCAMIGGGGMGCGALREARQSAASAPQISLLRGSVRSYMTLALPFLTGTQFNLSLRNGVLSGTMSSGAAPGGGLRLRIEGSEVSGQGPHGPIQMSVIDEGGEIVADGSWNGGRLHMIFTGTLVRGTVPTNSAWYARITQADPFGNGAAARMRSDNRHLVDPGPGDTSCEYFLDNISPEGAHVGGSICGGMPQQTRLEIPAVASAWLTTTELVTVVLVVLSSPPPSLSESYGPQFDTQPGTGERL